MTLVEFRLEIVTVPVADVDRAKAFYVRAGFEVEQARHTARGSPAGRRAPYPRFSRSCVSSRASRATTEAPASSSGRAPAAPQATPMTGVPAPVPAATSTGVSPAKTARSAATP